MIEKPKFMNNESLYDYDEEGEVILTEKGMKDPETVKEFIQFKIDLELYK